MLMFTLAISCLITSNLPWFMDLTFQVPMQYCSLQHQTFHIHNWVLFLLWSIPSFFLELFLHWSPVAYWAPTDPGSSSFSILSFCFFILFMGFSRQEYWSGLPFPFQWTTFNVCIQWNLYSLGRNTGVGCHALLQWTTFCQTSPPWPARLGLPHRHGLVSLS